MTDTLSPARQRRAVTLVRAAIARGALHEAILTDPHTAMTAKVLTDLAAGLEDALMVHGGCSRDTAAEVTVDALVATLPPREEVEKRQAEHDRLVRELSLMTPPIPGSVKYL